MKSGISLKVKAMDAVGSVIHEECIENDLFLWNWAVFWAQFFKMQFDRGNAMVYEWTDTAGTVKNTSAGDLWGTYYSAGNRYPGMNKGRILIGSGQTPPIILDHALEIEVAEVAPSPPVVVTDGDVIKILFTATFTFQEETICGEVGVALWDFFDERSEFLITRDIFTPVTVPAGGAIALQYELWFNGTPA